MKNAIRICCCALVLQSLPVLPFMVQAQIPEGWEWQNPLPHGLNIRTVKMATESFAIAGCDDGNIMRSWDGGQTWRTTRIASADILDLHTTASGLLWAATANGNLLHSSDFGDTWHLQLGNPEDWDNQMNAIAFAGSDRGLFLHNGKQLYRTSDGGQHWETASVIPKLTRPVGDMMVAKSPVTWYLLGYASSNLKLYRSFDFGKTWKSNDTLFDTSQLLNLVFVDSLYGYRCHSGRLYRTTDGGFTWSEMDVFGFGSMRTIEAGARLGSAVYCLSTGDVLLNRSTDGGETWNISLLNNAFSPVQPVAMSFCNATTGLVVGGSGRILRTSDGGASWSMVHGIGYPAVIVDLEFTTERTGLALGSGNVLLLTSNGGDRWIETKPSEEYAFHGISMYAQSSGFGYASDGNGTYYLLHSGDAGKTWQLKRALFNAFASPVTMHANFIHAVSENEIYIGAWNERLFRSRDGGLTFDSLTFISSAPFGQNGIARVQKISPSGVFITATEGLYVSADDGGTWEYRSLKPNWYFYDSYFTDTAKGYALINQTFSVTTDGGRTWKPTAMQSCSFMNAFSADTIAVFRSGYTNAAFSDSLLLTYDGGNSWTSYNLRERNNPYGWFWINPTRGWMYGYGGMIRKTDSRGIVGIENILAVLPAMPVLEQNYPNPVSLSRQRGATVQFVLPEAAQVSFSLYDILGRQLYSSALRRYEAGAHFLTLGGDVFQRLPANQPVFYSLTAGQTRLTKTMMIVE